jgi:hypothetical protein
MKVLCAIVVREVDGETTLSANPSLAVESHWNQHGADGLVVLRFEGNSVAVHASELAAAVERCRDVP